MGSALLAIGARAMFANYAALQTTGSNIANANTEGYSRQSVDLETAGGQFTGAGFFGKGVTVSTVSRAHNEFLTREAAVTSSVAAADLARSSQLQQLENIFPVGEDGIGYAAGQLFSAFVDVASKPQDASARQVVLSRAGELAARFRTAGEQLDALQSGLVMDFKTDVARVNTLATQIASLNQSIAKVKGSGQEPNDLLDQRDTAINELSRYLQVSTIAADDGSVSVFIGGGQNLVLSSRTTTLVTLPDALDPSKVRLGVRDSAGERALPNDIITAGSIAGLLQFQNTDLTDSRNLLGQMAIAIAGSMNEQQALGLDLNQAQIAIADRQSGGAIFGVGAPQVFSTSTARLAVTIDDSSLVKPTDYQLRYDGADTYTLTRLSGQVPALSVQISAAELAAGYNKVDGLNIRLAAGTPAVGDRFLLMPAGPAARGMTRVLDDPRGIAAAAPVTGIVGVDNRGTAGVALLRASSPGLNPNLTATITFDDDLGNYRYDLVDTTGALGTTSGTGTWTAGQPIKLNGWELSLSGVPRGEQTINGVLIAGDTITVAATAFPESNNGNANAMLALRDGRIVGGERRDNGASGVNVTDDDEVIAGDSATDAYASLLANVGVRVQSAKAAALQSETIAADAKAQQVSKAGVNLDEEAARLIQYQQSYQAAAKMLQIAQSVFDTVLELGR